MSEHIDRAAQVIYDELSGKYGDFNMPTGAAEALDAAGLLASPAHDAAVAARALRQVADALDAEDSNEWANDADWEAVRIIGLIRDRADLYERDGATS